MELFNVINPSPLLTPYIKNYWTLKVSDLPEVSQRIITSGSMSLVFHRGQRMFSTAEDDFQPQSFVCGLSANYTDLYSRETVDMIVAVFRPFGGRVFFNMPMNEFHDKSISLDDLEDKTLLELKNRILNEPDDKVCINLIERFFLKRLYLVNDYNYTRMVASINTINCRPSIDIKSLADITCLSYKQFNRIFTGYIGANPKEFIRIVRFQRALFILQNNAGISMTSLAYECGYYDQPHLVKEFKSFSGYTPTEYIAICAPYSDYFSES